MLEGHSASIETSTSEIGLSKMPSFFTSNSCSLTAMPMAFRKGRGLQNCTQPANSSRCVVDAAEKTNCLSAMSLLKRVKERESGSPLAAHSNRWLVVPAHRKLDLLNLFHPQNTQTLISRECHASFTSPSGMLADLKPRHSSDSLAPRTFRSFSSSCP